MGLKQLLKSTGQWLLGAGLALAVASLTACPSTLIRLDLENVPDPHTPQFGATLAGLTSSLTARGTVTGFWHKPAEIYAARLEAIRLAQSTIHFETFFMTPGKRCDEFANALIERAHAGVKVRFIADHNGTRYLPPAYWERLVQAGVELRFYHMFELARPFTYNTRTHRKILAIDGEIAFTGGTGVSDNWDANGRPGQPDPWIDAEVRLRGPVVQTLEGIFLQHWVYVGGKANMGPKIFKPLPVEGQPILVTPGNPTDGDSPIRAFYYANIVAARKRIWIASPYFLPDRNAMDAILAAKRRGVDVRILTVGPSNDQPFIYHTVNELYGDLVNAGIPIYEYQPAMMHAKIMLVDEQWVATGSANFDPRSFFHNDELLVSTSDKNLAVEVERFFTEALGKSKAVTPAAWQARSTVNRLQGQLGLLVWWQL